MFPGEKLAGRELALTKETAATLAGFEDQRPKTRGDCLVGGRNGKRPCPWVSCSHHLALDVNPGGSIKIWRPLLRRESQRPGMVDLHENAIDWNAQIDTCSLDVADSVAPGETLPVEKLVELTGVGDARLRQMFRKIQKNALFKNALKESNG